LACATDDQGSIADNQIAAEGIAAQQGIGARTKAGESTSAGNRSIDGGIEIIINDRKHVAVVIDGLPQGQSGEGRVDGHWSTQNNQHI